MKFRMVVVMFRLCKNFISFFINKSVMIALTKYVIFVVKNKTVNRQLKFNSPKGF